MKEVPVLFRGEMVRAILDNRKTQTRRILKPEKYGAPSACKEVAPYCTGTAWPLAFYWKGGSCWNSSRPIKDFEAGMHLWVRETWKPTGLLAFNKPSETQACGRFAYAADDSQASRDANIPWRPSIHMPRWASRITLEITAVRIQRLWDISAADILAEGAVDRPHEDKYLGKMPVSAFDGKAYPDLKSLWGHGWEQIYGKGSWTQNPWVAAITFKRV